MHELKSPRHRYYPGCLCTHIPPSIYKVSQQNRITLPGITNSTVNKSRMSTLTTHHYPVNGPATTKGSFHSPDEVEVAEVEMSPRSEPLDERGIKN